MLDLQPIKDRLKAATPGPWRASHNSKPLNAAAVAEVNTTFILPDTPMLSSPHKDADLIAHAPSDLAALVAEVERLRGAIEAHRQNKTAPGPTSVNSDDRDLWAVLE